MFYLMKTPTAKWYCGESVRKLADVYNDSLQDKRLRVHRSNLYALLRGEIKCQMHKFCEIEAFKCLSDVPKPPEGISLTVIMEKSSESPNGNSRAENSTLTIAEG